MSVVIPSNKGGFCAICREDFNQSEERLTHVGGEDHDGFHPECLRKWLILKPICPTDRRPINPDFLLTRTDRLMARLKPALFQATCAACFGSMAAGTIIGPLKLLPVAADAAKAIAETVGIPLDEKTVVVAVIGGGLVAQKVGAEVLRQIAQSILNRIEIGEIPFRNIQIGILAGGMATAAACVGGVVTPLMAIPTTSLVAGIIAGIFSLYRT